MMTREVVNYVQLLKMARISSRSATSCEHLSEPCLLWKVRPVCAGSSLQASQSFIFASATAVVSKLSVMAHFKVSLSPCSWKTLMKASTGSSFQKEPAKFKMSEHAEKPRHEHFSRRPTTLSLNTRLLANCGQVDQLSQEIELSAIAKN